MNAISINIINQYLSLKKKNLISIYIFFLVIKKVSTFFLWLITQEFIRFIYVVTLWIWVGGKCQQFVKLLTMSIEFIKRINTQYFFFCGIGELYISSINFHPIFNVIISLIFGTRRLYWTLKWDKNGYMCEPHIPLNILIHA